MEIGSWHCDELVVLNGMEMRDANCEGDQNRSNSASDGPLRWHVGGGFDIYAALQVKKLPRRLD